MMKIKVFTHGADIDGLGCGFLIQLAHKDDEVDIQYVNYNDVNVALYNFLKSGAIDYYDKVYITDISISEKMCNWIEQDYWHKFKLIDHHINEGTEHLDNYIWCRRRGEEDGEVRSATYLVAKYLDLLGQYKFIDDVVEHIDNYDTWKWQSKEDLFAKTMNDVFYIIGRERFLDNLWEQFYDGNKCYTVDSKIEFMLELRQEEYERHLENANKYMKRIQWKDYVIGVVFNDKFTSELGNDLCKLNDDIDFVAMINFKTGISLRGVKDGLHLGDIAKEIGEQIGLNGGGHPASAGITFNDDIRNKTILALIKNSELMLDNFF